MKYELKNRRVVSDTETNGLLREVTKIHCAVMFDIDSGEILDFGPDEIDEFLEHYKAAKLVVGHNWIMYDAAVIKKLYGVSIPRHKIRDTLIMARLYNSDIKEEDFPVASKWKSYKKAVEEYEAKIINVLPEKPKEFPGNLVGSHSLEAWGYRLGSERKGDYAKEMKAKGLDPWAEWNPDMHSYMIQDGRVGLALWLHLSSMGMTEQSIVLEHRVAWLASHVEQNGFGFNYAKAESLLMDLVARKNEIESDLHQLFPPWRERLPDFVPKVNNKTRGYVKGVPVERWEEIEFNPSSRDHIANRLMFKYGWQPTEYTSSGKPTINDEVLSSLDYPEAKLLAESFVLDKRIGALSSGKNSWLNCYNPETGTINARYNTNGAQTGRMTHSTPNIAQVPSTKNAKGNVPYGKECRDLFEPAVANWKQIGADQMGLELRCLASFLAAIDGGEYARLISSPGFDSHWYHGKMLYAVPMDIPRDEHNDTYEGYRTVAKRFIYAFLYGAGDAKLGEIIGKGPLEGGKLRKTFLANFPALATLINTVQTAAKRGWIKGLDGRKLPIRSPHAALNTLLQSAGALICKQWMVDFFDCVTGERWDDEGCDFVVNTWEPEWSLNLKAGWDGDFSIMGLIHDEMQIASKPEHAETLAELAIKVAVSAGNAFATWRCPTNGDAKIGNSWLDCH